MKLLTLIDKKVNNNIELTLDELKFLYEIDGKITGFGYWEDPRIEEIKRKRNKRRDYSLIFNVKEEEVALSQEEYNNYSGEFKVLVDDFDLNHIIFNDHIPNSSDFSISMLLGFLRDFNFLTNNDGIILPQYVVGNLYLNELANANKLVFPKFISGSLFLSHLTYAKEVVLPQYIGGDLYLSDLTNIEKLKLPQNIDGDLILDNLTSSNNLILSQHIGGYIYLTRLKTVDNLKLPYGFDLNRLYCPYNIKEEIMNNPDKYYMEPPTEEDKKGIKR